jgi:hypothetical protein
MTQDLSTLPAAVATYIQASNNFDLRSTVEVFADDALVVDANREFWGKDAISQFLEREIIGAKVTMDVRQVVEHRGDFIVSAAVDGTFDKSKLPSPLILAFHFWTEKGKIARMIVITKQPTPAWAEGEKARG